MKVGRNDTCPCGSGKKFKKCHLWKSQEIIADMTNRINIPEPYIQNGKLVGRPIIATHFKDRRVIAVGSRIYHSLPSKITFHEFLIVLLKDVVGQVWGKTESEKLIQEQHLIVQWIAEMSSLLSSSADVVIEREDGDAKSSPASGNVQSLLALAYDIYSVIHSSDLPLELINRLKNSDQFQGAKYEIAVAGIFARAGFKIEWIPEAGEKRCEFIATHRVEKQKIIVEAKSRHRQGVLGRAGIREELSEMRSQIGRLFNSALEKPTHNMPFMIFIDINLPLTAGNNDLSKRWIGDIKQMLGHRPIGTAVNPDPFTSLFITNFSWHYYEQNTEINKGESITVIPLYPKVQMTKPNLINLLRQSSSQYGGAPPMFPKET